VLDDLLSLDPEIHRNLMFVKHCDDASVLDLDFTVCFLITSLEIIVYNSMILYKKRSLTTPMVVLKSLN